jgi:hypothetical protein
MQKILQFVVLLFALLATMASFAAEQAILRNGFSIRHERRTVMGDMTRLYTGPDGSYIDIPTADIDHFEIDSTPAPKRVDQPAPTASAAAPAVAPTHPAVSAPATPSMTLDQIVGQASDSHKIDPDFINSVIRAESGFNIRAISPKGARGLMQLMPQTANDLGVKNSFDPKANVDGGTRYLRFLLEKYNYDVVKALAAYNAGPQRVDKYHGIPPYYETQAYVARIIRDYNRKKIAEQKAGAKGKPPQAPANSASRPKITTRIGDGTVSKAPRNSSASAAR